MANPNPNPSTRFGAPNGNPNGKTAETKKLEMLNAESAMRIRAKLLAAAEAELMAMPPQELMRFIEPAILKLLKDSEDRGMGAPIQQIGGVDGSPLHVMFNLNPVKAKPEE